MIVNTHFKEARLRARLSQRELSERTGISRVAISYVDRGAVPGFGLQRVLADALGADQDKLWPTGPWVGAGTSVDTGRDEGRDS